MHLMKSPRYHLALRYITELWVQFIPLNLMEKIKRTKIWSLRLRCLHWLIALSVLFLLGSGWLSAGDHPQAESARAYHYLAAYIFTGALIARLSLLFFGRESEHFSDCLAAGDRQGMVQSYLRFYLTLGKTEIKGWYAHNPLWGPVYLFILFFSLLMVFSGFAIGRIYLGSQISLSGIHAFGAAVFLLFTVLHLFAVVLHDGRAEATGVSAMLSGNKYFPVKYNEK